MNRMTQTTPLSTPVDRVASGIGSWSGPDAALARSKDQIQQAISRIKQPLYLLLDADGRQCLSSQGHARLGEGLRAVDELSLLGYVPATPLQALGDVSFCRDHGLRYPYMCGAMANGIASVELVIAAANAGLLASFGAAGLTLSEIATALDRLQQELPKQPYACNLIFTPNEKGHEDGLVSMLIERGVRLVETSAYMSLTLPVVRYRLHGIRRNAQGVIETPNRIIAKASRVELASKWFSPPPDKMLAELLAAGEISEQQAQLARQIPMAQDLTVEADSGGHTDNRPAITVLPTIMALRDRLQAEHNYPTPLRVGAAGGIATPASAAAAFAMGAAYIVTGTVNQACVESGSSDIVRQMLAEAGQADVAMAPAVDMFEMGVELQVLKRGTLFPMRAKKLYEIYRKYESLESIPQQEREALEKTVFRAPLADIWALTRDFFQQRDARQVERAAREPKHKMALVFRWYLGLSSRWANAGDETRQVDYQVWCGPAMGAFNEWTRGSFLETASNRTIARVAMNILYGAACVIRINALKIQGAQFASEALQVEPLKTDVIEDYLK